MCSSPQSKSRLTSGRDVDVEREAVLLLFFDERRQSLASGQLSVAQSGLVEVRHWLRADRPVLERHPHAVPLLRLNYPLI